MLYDEDEAKAHIKALHRDGKNHLSHIVRNGLCCVLAVHHTGGDVEKAIYEFEKKWEALGL